MYGYPQAPQYGYSAQGYSAQGYGAPMSSYSAPMGSYLQPAQPQWTSGPTTVSASHEAASAAATTTVSAQDTAFVEQKLAQSNILVFFSKTYCPFVNRAKAVLNSLHPRPVMDIIELDLMGQPRHGPIQQVLRQWTGSSTVPQAFVNATYIGGCQDIESLHQQGQLVPRLRQLGCRFQG
jgi:glutaredoxin 3